MDTGEQTCRCWVELSRSEEERLAVGLGKGIRETGTELDDAWS